MAEQGDSRPKVLVTGASGLIGGLVVRNLSDQYIFSGLNRRPVEGIKSTQADIADLDAIRPAFEGIDMVVHMSAETKDLGNWDKIISNSIVGTVNVFRAAQEAGVKRVIFGSSGGSMCGWERDESLPYGKLAAGRYDEVTEPWPLMDVNDVPRADAPYAIAKLFGENTARWYSDVYDMSMLCIRLGAVLPDDKPLLIRHFPGYLSHADCVQIIEKSLAAPMSLRWAVYDALSENKYRWRDTTFAKEVLGYKPTGTADIFNPDDFR